MDYLSLRNRAHLVCTYFPSSLPLTVLSYFLLALNRLRRGQPRRIPLVFQAMADGLRNRMGKPGADLLPRGNIRVLFLTLRADFGGGPEHLWQLLTCRRASRPLWPAHRIIRTMRVFARPLEWKTFLSSPTENSLLSGCYSCGASADIIKYTCSTPTAKELAFTLVCWPY